MEIRLLQNELAASNMPHQRRQQMDAVLSWFAKQSKSGSAKSSSTATWIPPMPISHSSRKPSKLSAAEAAFWECAEKLKAAKSDGSKAALLWDLAFSSRLRDLEDIRPAGGFKP